MNERGQVLEKLSARIQVVLATYPEDALDVTIPTQRKTDIPNSLTFDGVYVLSDVADLENSCEPQ